MQALPRVPLGLGLAVRAGARQWQEPIQWRLHPLSLLQCLPKVSMALQLLPLPVTSSQQQLEGLHTQRLPRPTRLVPQHPPLVALQQPLPRSLWPRLP